MNEIRLTLLRTVFLPMVSPPIGSVLEIRSDISKADINVDAGQLYCLGEMDILIDYLSFTADAGKQLFAKQQSPYPSGSGKEWQAMLSLPFVLSDKPSLQQAKAMTL